MSQTPLVSDLWDNREVHFFLGDYPSEVDPVAVIVFAWNDPGWLLANIPGRGWTVPSGHIEMGETPEVAAHRETWEEVGGILKDLKLLGYYLWSTADGTLIYFPTYTGLIDTIEAVPETSESLGVKTVHHTEIPGCYWKWDKLLETVFETAHFVVTSSGT